MIKDVESYRAGVQAGMESYKEALIKYNDLLSSLKLQCQGCGGQIFARAENGILEIPVCFKCKMNEFDRGVEAGIKNYAKKIGA